MNKLKANPLRLRANHPRFPVDMILKNDNGVVMACKYCGRTPLVEHFDFSRTKDDKEEATCVECYDEGRAFETNRDRLVGLGFVMSGLKNYSFPLAPEKGTPKREVAGKCGVCGKPVYSNPYTQKYIGAYYEHIRGVLHHADCEP